jgi:hypothetical protein
MIVYIILILLDSNQSSLFGSWLSNVIVLYRWIYEKGQELLRYMLCTCVIVNLSIY